MKTSQEPLFLKLNDITYKLDNKAQDGSAVDSNVQNPWFDYCKKQGFSNCSSATIGTIVNLIEKNTPAEATETTVQEQTDLFLKHSAFFEEAVVHESIYKLKSTQLLLQSEFDAMDKRKKEIEAREGSKRRLMFYGFSTFFTAQFLIGYHAIFNVEWLGWDLVEPLTYTVGQGSFILGMIYCLRYRGFSVEYSDLEDYY